MSLFSIVRQYVETLAVKATERQESNEELLICARVLTGVESEVARDLPQAVFNLTNPLTGFITLAKEWVSDAEKLRELSRNTTDQNVRNNLEERIDATLRHAETLLDQAAVSQALFDKILDRLESGTAPSSSDSGAPANPGQTSNRGQREVG